MKKVNLYLDLDGTLAEFLYNNKITIDNWEQSGIFLNRKPTALISIVHNFIKQAPNKINVRVISCAPHLDSNPNWFQIHKYEKLIWIDKHIPFKVLESHIVPWKPKDHQLKIDYLIQNKLWNKDEVNVLIDDDYNELYGWENKGGIAYHISSFLTKERLAEFKKLLTSDK